MLHKYREKNIYLLLQIVILVLIVKQSEYYMNMNNYLACIERFSLRRRGKGRRISMGMRLQTEYKYRDFIYKLWLVGW